MSNQTVFEALAEHSVRIDAQNRRKERACVAAMLSVTAWSLTLSGSPALGGACNPSWWNLDYPFRRPLVVTNTAAASLESQYTVSAMIDHALLVAQGQSLLNGDDVRVVYFDGLVWFEVDRIVHPASNWNSPTTTILYRTIEPIPAGGDSAYSYWLYYGNAQAVEPPADPTDVYLFFDDFASNTLAFYTWSGTTLMTPTYDEANERVRFFGREQGLFTPVGAPNGDNAAVGARVLVAQQSATNIMMLGARSTGVWSSGCTAGAVFGGIYDTEPDVPKAAITCGCPSHSDGPVFEYALGQWYQIEMRVVAQSAKLFVDGALTYEAPACDGGGEHLTLWVASGPSGAADFEGFFDDWSVRKLLAPEPSVLVGAEQHSAGAVFLCEASPPLDNPYLPGEQPFRDVLQDVQPVGDVLIHQGIGGVLTPDEDPIEYAPIKVTFSAPLADVPMPVQVQVACTDVQSWPWPSVESVTHMSGSTYELRLTDAVPPGGCTTFTFTMTEPPLTLRYEYLPGDVNMNGITNTQDLLALVQCLNSPAAGVDQDARCDINRNGVANTQDLLRLVQLLNGVNSTRAWNGATLVPCE